jgi:hypothetical protein
MQHQEILAGALTIMFFLGIFVVIYRLRTKSAYVFAASFALSIAYRTLGGRGVAYKIAEQILGPTKDFSGPANTAKAFEFIGLASQIDEFIFSSLVFLTMLAFVFMAFSIPRPQFLSNNKP